LYTAVTSEAHTPIAPSAIAELKQGKELRVEHIVTCVKDNIKFIYPERFDHTPQTSNGFARQAFPFVFPVNCSTSLS
jgi:hypothetical protein